MNTDNNDTEFIEQYLRGELRGPLLEAFERKLGQDAYFRREVQLQRDLVRSICQTGLGQVRAELKAIHQEVTLELEEETCLNQAMPPAHWDGLPPGAQPPYRFLRKDYRPLWAVAASIALLVVSTLFWSRRAKEMEYEVLFKNHFRPYPNVGYTSRRGGEGYGFSDPQRSDTARYGSLRGNVPENPLLVSAFNAYDQGNYAQSVLLFEKVLREQEDEIVLFYLGVAYLGSDQLQPGINALERYRGKYHTLAPEAGWYLSLAYLKSRQVHRASSLLKSLAETDNDFSGSAGEVLRSLE